MSLGPDHGRRAKLQRKRETDRERQKASMPCIPAPGRLHSLQGPPLRFQTAVEGRDSFGFGVQG